MKRVSSSDALRYHGDQAATMARLDFAVNVHAETPPAFLREVMQVGVEKLGSYPTQELFDETRHAIASHHNVAPANVLLLNGAAEGFSLIARLRPAWPVIIHPGFTEPEACLVDAGIEVEHVVLQAPFGLGGVSIPSEADMVIVGNPTNPTGVMHPVEDLKKLADPWRYLVVDEAFLDVTDGSTMIDLVGEIPGLIVLRSLTKTWSLAGLRCGYLIADEETITTLSRGRAAWPLGTLQLLAMKAIFTQGQAELDSIAEEILSNRENMIKDLVGAGFKVHHSSAPYLLVEPPGDAEALRKELELRQISVRRCDTFPGLDLNFWRLAVRPPTKVKELLDEIARINYRSVN